MKIEKENTTIEIFDDYVVKHLKNKTKTQGWYESYLEFSADNPLYVKILDFEPSKLILEKVDIFSPVNNYLKSTEKINRDLCLNICESYFKVILDCVEYSKKEKNIYWTHDDLTIDNFVITKDNKIKLIDPDSFHFCKNPIDYKYSFGVIELENLMRKL
jgi:thiamine kinase-like enzyme